MDSFQGGPDASNGAIIKTPGLFNFMDLPVEIRLQIYPFLLSSTSGPIVVPHQLDPSYCLPGILETCKQIRTEALPLFYALNSFDFILCHRSDSSTSNPNNVVRFLAPLRWDHIASLPALTFQPRHSMQPSVRSRPRRTRFTCTGRQLEGVFTCWEKRSKPEGPAEIGALLMANWISRQVTDVEIMSVKKSIFEAWEHSVDSDGE